MTDAPPLAKTFQGLEDFRTSKYELLPFKFLRVRTNLYLLTNLTGEHILLTHQQFQSFVEQRMESSDEVYFDLKAKHFLFTEDSRVSVELLATKYRTLRAPLADFTSLHIFVVTLRCDHSCHYCQVSRVSQDRSSFDMTEETATKAIDLMLKSPSPHLKVEFQGGESLLNFDLIKFIVETTKVKAGDRIVDFVIASNLSAITDEILGFAKENRIHFSCSLDGFEELHNSNRPRPGNDSYQKTIQGITKIRDLLGPDSVAALMTTTAASLKDPKPLIDEYARQGFSSIFLRWLSPYGFATKAAKKLAYETDSYIKFYKAGLDYILELNLQGNPLREDYASIILQKILRPYPHGYVDLQSPSGLCISVLVYNYNGDIYASDEGRMLAEMGDQTFRVGSVHTTAYQDIFFETSALELALDTMLEGVPGCSDCALLPYCGVDPVFHHVAQGDFVGHKPTSAFCQRNMAIILHLLDILHAGGEKAAVLKSWI